MRRAALSAAEFVRLRYPFSEWASSAARASCVEDRLDDPRRLDGRLGDQQTHRGQLARVAGAHAAIACAARSSAASRVDQDLLAGAEPFGDVDHRQFGGRVQHRHDELVVAQPSATATMRSTSASRPPRGRHVAQHADDPAGEQRRQDRAGVRPAPVDGRPADPGAAGDLGERHPIDAVRQHAARRGVEDPVPDVGELVSLLIDSICNTVTHDSSADEVECLGRPGRRQTALRRDSRAARAGARRRATPSLAELEPDEVRLRPSALSAADRAALAAIVGAEHCGDRRPRATAARRRQVHAGPVAAHGSRTQDAPDAVLTAGRRGRDRRDPGGYCSQRGIAVVPFGGGTSVVGGLDPIRGQFGAVISLDLRRLDELHSLDEISGEAELGAGRHRTGGRTAARRARLLARALPAELPVRDDRRLRGDPLVGPGLGGLRPVQRHGPRPARGHPGRRAGPRPRTRIGGRSGPAPAVHRLRGRVRRHHPGATAGAPGAASHPLRGVVVPGLRDRRRRAARRHPDRHRPDRASGCPTRPRPASTWPPPRASASSSITGGCLAITVFEGTDGAHREPARRDAGAARQRTAARRWARRPPGRGSTAGSTRRTCATRCWPAGALCETLETATNWSNLDALKAAVTEALTTALAESGTPALVLCHISHVYPTGASLYFTVVAGQRGNPIEQWRTAKTAASRCDGAHRRARSPTTTRSAPTTGRGCATRSATSACEVLRAVKAALDPAGNPQPGQADSVTIGSRSPC